ncbi:MULTISPECIES: amiloride-sensitive sodium channel family protein [unclassified Petrotoga]|nr:MULTISPECIES: amiloride-sensitive sodium channel family protein [unclassified Petrotoga]PNR94439.1 hypothetical protein X926_00410 [Petrotoga sp. HWHPT.55.6.3]
MKQIDSVFIEEAARIGGLCGLCIGAIIELIMLVDSSSEED